MQHRTRFSLRHIWLASLAVGLALVVSLVAFKLQRQPLAKASSTTAVLATMTTLPGWDIFSSVSPNYGYRYGPAIIVNSDGSDDMWTCSPGDPNHWDYIRYRHSTDNGHTWTADQIVLQPTNGSTDSFSTCDPGVVNFGGYYYIGYTSTQNALGTSNDVFLARSTSPSGPFDKWNGSGWGGNPQPVISYAGSNPNSDYGAGEPSMVYANNTIYLYYTWAVSPVSQTRVATVVNPGANWPSSLSYQGVAINRHTLDEDSTDIKYDEDLNEFVGVSTDHRFTAQALVVTHESTDGIHFVASTMVSGDSTTYAHNAGMSGEPNGHFRAADSNFIAFAYGDAVHWGQWNTHLSPMTITNRVGNASFETPSEGSGYAYGPSSATWSFSGTSGISGNGSGFTSGNPSAPDGSQVAILQETGSFSQSINGLQAGVGYQVVFSAAQRANISNQRQNFNVQIDGITIGTFQPSGTSYSDFTSSTFQVNSGTHTLQFVGVDSVGGDNTAFIDNVRLTIASLPAAVQNMSFSSPSLTPLNASASSSIGGLPPANATDSNSGTFWSSNGHSGSAANESFTLDLGSNQLINSVHVIPRTISDTDYAFPDAFSIQVSTDGTNFTPVVSYTNYANPASKGITMNFGVNTARYVQMAATDLRTDNGATYYFQLAEFSAGYVPNPALTATASSTYSSSFSPSRAVDGDTTNFWSSIAYTTSNATEWLAADLGHNTVISGINVVPRHAGTSVYCFPSAFTLQSSTDGTNWTTIAGQSYSSYPTPTSTGVTFTFSTPVYARAIRMQATALSTDNNGGYLFQLAEVSLLYTSLPPVDAIGSSQASSGFAPANAIDGSSNSVWSSTSHGSNSATEWLEVDAGRTALFTGVQVIPRTSGSTILCFPTAFSLQSSTDGINWTTIAGQSYTNFPTPTSQGIKFSFGAGVSARAIRMVATTLTTDDFGVYYFQLAEMQPTIDVPFVPASLLDSDPGTFWSSLPHTSATATEWASFDLGTAQSMSQVTMLPRVLGTTVEGFPTAFSLQTSNDGTNWTTITGQSYSGYATPSASGVTFNLGSGVNARYFRINATTLSQDNTGLYVFQLADLSLQH